MMRDLVASDVEIRTIEEENQQTPTFRRSVILSLADRIILFFTRDGRGLQELTLADARSVFTVVNLCLQTFALCLVMGRGSTNGPQETRKFRCYLKDGDAGVLRDTVNISSCSSFFGRPVRGDFGIDVLGVAMLITYMIELTMNVAVHPRKIFSSICLSAALIWAFAVAYITDAGGAYQRQERFLRLMSVSLFGVSRFLPAGGTFYQASKHILKALIPLVVFVLVAAVAAACVMGLDGMPYTDEDALVKVRDDDRPQEDLFSVSAADFCKRSESCFKQPYFANIWTSTFTMFQMATADSWATDIAWPTFQFNAQFHPMRAYLRMLGLAFFVGFHTLIIGNFVTAVIVEAVLEHTKSGQAVDEWIEDKQEHQAEEEPESRSSSAGTSGEALVAVRQLAAQLVRLEAKVDQLTIQRG